MKPVKRLILLLIPALFLAAGLWCSVPAHAETATDAFSLLDRHIYIPENPTVLEQTAAEELDRYLEKITGRPYRITKSDATDIGGIFIGNSRKAAAVNVTAYPNINGSGEGWAIEVIGDSLYLTGGETRGVLYSVYHLLEDELGVRWWNPWEEYIPSNSNPTVAADYFDSGEPKFTYRDIYTGAESMQTLFFTRNRMNGWVSNAPQSYGGEITYTLPYHTHTFNRYFYESDFNAHPEWFALVDGVRIPDGQLCLSNEALVQEFATRMKSWIKESYRQADVNRINRPIFADITPNDMGGFCQCADCTASTAASGPSGHLLKFINKVAADVEQTYPDIILAGSAYWQYYEVPLDDTVPRSNVMIRLASNDVDLIHNIHHPNNTQVKARMQAWADLLEPGQLYYWDYAVHYDRMYGIVPNYFKFQQDYQLFHEEGGAGVFAELEMINSADMWDMNLWLMTKIMEDPYQDVYQLAQDYTNGYYGQAAGADVFSYLTFMEEAAEDYDTSITFGKTAIRAPWLTAADVMRAHGYFESAVAKTKADTSISEAERERYLARLNVARKGLDQVILYNYNRFIYEAAEMGRSFNIDKKETGRRLVLTLKWMDNLTSNYTTINGVDNVKVRGSYNSDADYLFSRYQRYMGETDSRGDMWWPDVPQQVLDDHPNLDPRHIYDYPASAISYDSNTVTQVANAASYEGGSALVLDQSKLFTDGIKDSFTFSESKYISTTLDEKLRLGDPLIADGKYHLYRIENVAPYVDGRHTIAFFSGDINVFLEGQEHLLGNDTEIELYLSMKIEGNPSGEDPSNYGKIYVDRMVIVESCDIYKITGSKTAATCAAGETTTGPCPVCGKTVSVEDESTRLPHKITGDYVYDPITSTYTAQCSVCGDVTYEFRGKLPDDLLADLKKDGRGPAHIKEFIVSNFELWGTDLSIANDPQSPVGDAVTISVADCKDTTIPVAAYPGGTYGYIYTSSLQANIGKGYVTYKFSDVKLPTGAGDAYYWYMFYSWHLQSRQMMRELQPLAGHTADVYVSMKATATNYYIDRIFVVDRCSNYVVESDSYLFPPTCTSDAVISKVCRLCGGFVAGELHAGSALGHDMGDYLYDEALGMYVSSCKREDCNYSIQVRDLHAVTIFDGQHETVQIVPDGASIEAPDTPRMDGYTFDGWYDGDTKFDVSSAVTKDLHLTPGWISSKPVSGYRADTQIANGYATLQTEALEDCRAAICFYTPEGKFIRCEIRPVKAGIFCRIFPAVIAKNAVVKTILLDASWAPLSLMQ